MAEPSRGLQISRRSWLLAGLAVPLSRAWAADSFSVTYDGDNLHVSGSDLHFLTGKPLERLKMGSTVTYGGVVRLFVDQYATTIRRTEVQFAVSYDVLEDDKFAVKILGNAPRSAANLSAAATEAWCLENLFITAAGLASDRPFWLQLDLGIVNKKNISGVFGNSGISFASLIDLFSPDKALDPRWIRQVGPWRIADLARASGRGRNG